MIKSLDVKNFRCFKSLYLGDLKRFNVIVGESGSGKTALLEAIFMTSAGSPEIWLRLRQWRGSSPQIRLSGTRLSYESLFRDIFYNFESYKPARLQFTDYDSRTRSLVISYPKVARTLTRVKSGSEDSEDLATVEPIEFFWKVGGHDRRSRVDFKNGTVNFRSFTDVYPVWFSSPGVNEAQNISEAFSYISMRKRTGGLVEAVRKIYPEILDLSVESIAGDLALCVSLPTLPEKLPVGAMSSGMTRFLALMIAIATNPNGVLLIDEFEVGFYYKTLPTILQAIFSFCEEHNVQIFATTHSYEFMQTLVPFMKGKDEAERQFEFFRAEKKGADFSMRRLADPAAALESHFEVR